MRRRFSVLVFTCVLGVVTLSLCSCRRTAATPAPPALDRDSFIEETGLNIPKDTEFISSTTSVEQDGVFSTLLLRMPKGAESLFPPPMTEFPPGNAARQLFVNQISQKGYSLKNPKDPCRNYQVQSKTRGKGFIGVLPDGDFIFVGCNFRLPK
jgi:hypothetical protein